MYSALQSLQPQSPLQNQDLLRPWLHVQHRIVRISLRNCMEACSWYQDAHLPFVQLLPLQLPFQQHLLSFWLLPLRSLALGREEVFARNTSNEEINIMNFECEYADSR